MDEIESRSKAACAAATLHSVAALATASRDTEHNGGSSAPDRLNGAAAANSGARDQPLRQRSSRRHDSPARTVVSANGHTGVPAAAPQHEGTCGSDTADARSSPHLASQELHAGAAAPAASQPSAANADGPSGGGAPAGSVPREPNASPGGFEAARQRLYGREGVPECLKAAADELRGAHPGVPFLDHAWGQARVHASIQCMLVAGKRFD